MALTLTPGVTALLESVMRPVRDAFDDCAMTKRAGNTIRAAMVMMRVIPRQRRVDFCWAKAGISVRVSRGKRDLPAVAGEPVRNWRPSISPKPPRKFSKRPQ